MRDDFEQAAGKQLRISETPGVRVRILRLWRPDAALVDRLEPVLGARLPVEPNTTSAGDARILWMAPGEWTLLGGPADLDQGVAQACGEALHHLSDVTEGRACLTIEGPAAPDLLASGCSLDFHPLAFRPATCAQSLLAQVRVLIDRPTEAALFDLIVDRSQLAHLQAWLQLAAAQFQDHDA
jgi:sarcosine oxidase subunit gamma